MEVTPIFSKIPRRIFQMCGTGKTRMATSVRIVKTAFRIQGVVWSMQCPGVFGSHFFCTGVHSKMLVQMSTSAEMMTRTLVPYAITRKVLDVWKATRSRR